MRLQSTAKDAIALISIYSLTSIYVQKSHFQYLLPLCLNKFSCQNIHNENVFRLQFHFHKKCIAQGLVIKETSTLKANDPEIVGYTVFRLKTQR